MNGPSVTSIPDNHFRSLAEIEESHFWSLSRLNWAEAVIRKRIADPSAIHMADYGCGTGGFIATLGPRLGVRSWRGIDLSANAVALAESRFGGGHFSQAASTTPNLPPETGLVTLMDVLEHIPSPVPFLAELGRPLRPGTGLLLSVPACSWLFSAWDVGLGHHRRYDRAMLTRQLEDAGWRVGWCAYAFSYLVPFALLRRLKPTERDKAVEFPVVAPWLTSVLMGFNWAERTLTARQGSPIGTSLFCWAERG